MPLPRYDFTDLALFVAVAESGSLTAGAARLPLALSAASQRIRKLEDSVGIALLAREHDGVSLTAAGEALLDHARRLLGEADKLQENMSAFASGLSARVRLYATTVASTECLPEAVGQFLADHPRVNVEIIEHSSAAIVRAITAQEVDIGVIDGNVGAAGLELLPIQRDRLVLVVPERHPLAGLEQCAFAAALDYPFVGLATTSGIQRFIENTAALAGKTVKLRVRAASFETLHLLVAREVGIAMLPESAALRYARMHGGTCSVAIAERWAERELTLAARSFSALPLPTRTFIRYLLKRES